MNELVLFQDVCLDKLSRFLIKGEYVKHIYLN